MVEKGGSQRLLIYLLQGYRQQCCLYLYEVTEMIMLHSIGSVGSLAPYTSLLMQPGSTGPVVHLYGLTVGKNPAVKADLAIYTHIAIYMLGWCLRIVQE